MNAIICELCGTEYGADLTSCPSCGVGVSAEANLPMGTELHNGKFTVGKVLGRGGFGITYKGAHKALQRPVAIKELFPEFAQRTGLQVTVASGRLEGFRREQDSVVQEARVIANLDSGNIVDVHDFFHENGTVYIVMEYLEGPTLEQEIERLGQLPANRVVAVADQVCDALDTMHRANLLHKDIKPANILLARDGRVVLIDFGSAREYETGKTQRHTRIVTLDYGAPEQFSQMARFGPYTDLFCLGATLYHALTGSPPQPTMDRLQAADSTVQLPSAVPNGLRQAVQEALHCRIDDRPQSVEDFRILLGATKATKDPPVRRNTVPTTRTATGSTAHGGVPYEFEGKSYHTPQDLVAALVQDWDAAIEEWRRGYIRAWMTKGVVGSKFERTIDRMEDEPLFRVDKAHHESGHLIRETAINNSETAVQERWLMRVFSIMDSGWQPSYRGMPLRDKEAIGAWCQTNQRARRSLVQRCLSHGVLLAHPKKFARTLHDRTLKECGVYRAQLHLHLDGGELASVDRDPEIVMFRVFSILVGARSGKDLIIRARNDGQAMKVSWFAELVENSVHSAGCAVALSALAPKAQQERSRFTVKVWVGIVGAILLLFLCGIVSSAA